ncbi:AfsR/SARP family transcriptional regulator [Micromonospora rifamycinica]|uniref:AfsR/SARP family transcriptional regulator n=1 Tax=Micromonospora rifamycinica TaxID=291594 RepID=UPI0034379B78
MRYEILGPLRIVDGDETSVITAPKIGVVLAVLLIRSGRLVPADQLVNEIWDDNVPRTATTGLHVYVSQLRKFLQRPGRGESPILTRNPGYLLRLGGDEFDLQMFRENADLARAYLREGRDELATAYFDRALGLCYGPVLGDLPRGPVIDGFVTWLTEERLECIEMSMETGLRLGRHRELVSRLYSLTAEWPLREVFHRQLMLALYRSDRQADALHVYQRLRHLLQRELGVEPCRSVRELHRLILMADECLDLCTA